MKDIEQIIITLDKIFPDVLFDIDKAMFGDGSSKWRIYVSDLDFYLNDKKFKKWVNILRKKYPKVRWFCVHQPNRFK